MAYVPDLVMSASAEKGVQVAGLAGAHVQIQYRESLATGNWVNLPDHDIVLADGVPVIALKPEETRSKAGFYRAVFLE